MDAGEIIRWMMNESGTSGVDLSHALGKSDSYIGTTLAKKSKPRLDSFVSMAEAMGFEVVIRRKDKDERVLSATVDKA